MLLFFFSRWAREGTLPYHKAAQVLPTEMKFSFYDAKIFNTKHSLDVQKAFVMCASMARLLEVDVKFTKEMCKIVTTAAIFDLQLSSMLYMQGQGLGPVKRPLW